MLTNVTYRGLIRHKDRSYPEQHPAIVDEALWDRVQAKLQAAASEPRVGWRRDGGRRPQGQGGPAASSSGDGNPASGFSSSSGSPLTGKLRDQTGDRLTPTHTVKAGLRIRYYVSSRLTQGRSGRRGAPSQDTTRGWRLPAVALEAAVAEALASHLDVAAEARTLLTQPRVAEASVAAQRARSLVHWLRADEPARSMDQQAGSTVDGRLDTAAGPVRDAALWALVAEGCIGEGSLHLALDLEALAAELVALSVDLSPTLLSVIAPFSLRRRGVELRLVAGSAQPSPDPKLVSALARAHRWAAEMRRGVSLAEIAARESTSESYISSSTRLSFLAPAIQTAILGGTPPTHLTLERIVRAGVPLDWIEQRRLYGFADA